MKQKRCSRCCKKRRFVEGGSTQEHQARRKDWVKIDGQWICRYCTPKPWHVTTDWTVEVVAANGSIIDKFQTVDEANAFIDAHEGRIA